MCLALVHTERLSNLLFGPGTSRRGSDKRKLSSFLNWEEFQMSFDLGKEKKKKGYIEEREMLLEKYGRPHVIFIKK